MVSETKKGRTVPPERFVVTSGLSVIVRILAREDGHTSPVRVVALEDTSVETTTEEVAVRNRTPVSPL